MKRADSVTTIQGRWYRRRRESLRKTWRKPKWLVPRSCARKVKRHSQSTESTIESSSEPREDGLSIFQVNWQEGFRPQSFLEDLMPLTSLQNRVQYPPGPVSSLQEESEEEKEGCLQSLRRWQ